MLAEISVAPSDHWQHMSSYVAEMVKLIEQSGLAYHLGAMGTTVEGEPEEVFELIKQLHLQMRLHSQRISTAVKIDDDVRRPRGRLEGKVHSVEDKLKG